MAGGEEVGGTTTNRFQGDSFNHVIQSTYDIQSIRSTPFPRFGVRSHSRGRNEARTAI